MANRVAATALYSGIGVGLVFTVLVFCFMEPILQLLGATTVVLPYAVAFTRIFMLGAVCNTLNLIIDQLAAAEGITRVPMMAMLLGSILNIVLNPLLIYGAGLGVSGSAWASVLSVLATSLFFGWFICRQQGVLRYTIAYFQPARKIFAEIFKIGIPMLVSQFLQSATLAIINIVAARYGEAALAAAGAVNRILPLGFFVVFGFLRGYGPFAGYNYGARQYDRLHEATRTALRWTSEFCIGIAVLLLLFPQEIMAPFSAGDAMALEVGAQMLRANGIDFLVFGFEMVYMMLFLSLGNGRVGGILSIYNGTMN
jgi:putative MATE family efflux protein